MQSHLSISYDPWMDHPLPMTFLQGVRTASSLSRCSREPFGIAVGGPTQKGRVYHFDDRWCFLSENIFWLRWWYWMTLIWIQHVMYERAVIIRQCSVAPCGRMQPKCTEFLGFLAGEQAAYRSLGLPCKFGMGWGWYNCIQLWLWVKIGPPQTGGWLVRKTKTCGSQCLKGWTIQVHNTCPQGIA
jgi:hypothetical protein